MSNYGASISDFFYKRKGTKKKKKKKKKKKQLILNSKSKECEEKRIKVKILKHITRL